MDETMLRVASVGSDADLQAVRDALDEIGTDHDHVSPEPDADFHPQTAYFQLRSTLTDSAASILEKLSEERGLDTEIL